MTAQSAPPYAQRARCFLQKIARSSGTRTTLEPVTNPRFCRRGVEEASGLEGVAAEHEEAERGAGEEFVAGDGAEGLEAERGHESGGERETE